MTASSYHSAPFDDELRFTLNAIRWMNEYIATRLWDRGWTVADPDVNDDQPLEWFWPPTAPVSYGGRPEWSVEAAQLRPHLYGSRRTPWTRPTGITNIGRNWRLEYGKAIGQEPDAPREYTDGAALIADLERIECWPMSVEETQRIRTARILTVTTAMAHDHYYLAVLPTEPYTSRLNSIQDHLWFNHDHDQERLDTEPTPGLRQSGDLMAQYLIADADAWASAARTARAGGNGWGINGPVDTA